MIRPVFIDFMIFCSFFGLDIHIVYMIILTDNRFMIRAEGHERFTRVNPARLSSLLIALPSLFLMAI
jgi:hypothetical protein